MSFAFLLLVVVGVAVALAARARSDAPDDGGGQRTLLRVFVYSLALLGALLVASGLSGLVRVALAALGPDPLVRQPDRGLAMGLSLLIVGLPVWALAWRSADGEAGRFAGERRALGRRLYLALLRGVALAVAVPHAVEAGRWLVGAEPYDPAAVARLLVWGALWAYHERVAAEVPFGSAATRAVDRAEVYLSATAGIALLAGALGTVLARSLERLYDVLARVPVLHGNGQPLEVRSAVAVAAVGALLWWWHWGVLGRRDVGSTGWLLYLFLVGVLSGTVTAVASGSVILHGVLAWVLGAAGEPAAVHFDVLPSAIAGLVVGASLWGYHRALLAESALAGEAGWSGPERVYRHLVTAAGLLTAAGGMAIVLAVGLDLLVPGRTLVQAPGGVRDVVAVGLTLLLIGVPLWARFWLSIQRQVRAQPLERTTLPRRALIFGVFGLAVVTAVVTLSTVLFELFTAVLAGGLSTRLIEEQRWGLALLLTAAAVSAHYALVLREDRATTPTAPASVRLREVIVVGALPEAVAEPLRQRLDVKVGAWERSDTQPRDLPDEHMLDDLAARLRGVGAARALVVVGGDGQVQLIPLVGA